MSRNGFFYIYLLILETDAVKAWAKLQPKMDFLHFKAILTWNHTDNIKLFFSETFLKFESESEVE